MTDRTINVGQTLDLTYFVSDEELTHSDDIIINSDTNSETINYKESLLWTPNENDAGKTHTFEVGNQELSIKVVDVPDSAVSQYEIIDVDGGGITSTETILDWTDALGENNEDKVFNEINTSGTFKNSFELEISSFVDSDDSDFDAFLSGFTTGNGLVGDDEFVGLAVGDNSEGTESLKVFAVSEPERTSLLSREEGTQVFGNFGTNETISVELSVDFDSGSLTVTAEGQSETVSFDETKGWSHHHVIATTDDSGFSAPGNNSGQLTNHSFSS